MTKPASSHRALRQLLQCAFAMVLAGCGGVREDREVDWSADGTEVAFQHAKEGVYIADQQTGQTRRIFHPNEDTIAVSRPIYSPDGTEVIFATAHPIHPDAHTADTPLAERELEPDGQVYAGGPGRYICWLGKAAADSTEPEKLFERTIPNIAYIAAGLAVRWDSNASAIYFLDQGNRTDFVTLRRFDRESREISRLIDWSARDIVFDVIPKSRKLACVRFGTDGDATRASLWIGLPNDLAPWTIDVPESEIASLLIFGNPINWLMHQRPRWTSDGSRFVQARLSIDTTPQGSPEVPESRSGFRILNQVFLGDRDNHSYQPLVEEPECRISDLRIEPGGSAFGYVRSDDNATSLVIVSTDTAEPRTIATGGIRNFVGWNSEGTHLAYSKSETDSADDSGSLFLIDRSARDRLVVLGANGNGPSKVVLERMRINYPNWSSQPNQLAAWLTFQPIVGNRLLPLHLARGQDPVATVDVATGEVQWMTVNDQERIQVGHFHALHGRYRDALLEYASGDQSEVEPIPPTTIDAWLADPLPAGNTAPFEAYAHWKLNASDDARLAIDRFRKVCVPPESEPNRFVGIVNRNSRQDTFLAEVCLNFDDIIAAIEILSDQRDRAVDDVEKFSRSFVLAHLHLQKGNVAEFVETLSADTLPALAKIPTTQFSQSDAEPLLAQFHTLVATPSLNEIPHERRQSLLDQLTDLAVTAASPDVAREFQLASDQIRAGLGQETPVDSDKADTPGIEPPQ